MCLEWWMRIIQLWGKPSTKIIFIILMCCLLLIIDHLGTYTSKILKFYKVLLDKVFFL